MPDFAMPELWLQVGGLVLLFIISFLGSGPVPVPLTVTVIWLGQFDFPVAVVAVATIGSLLGWYFLQQPIRRWFERRPALIDSIPVAYQYVLLRHTGFWLFFFNAIPFPVEPMRFLAVLNRYPPTRLLVIISVARMLRYSLLVIIGATLAEQKVLLWSVMLFFLVLPFGVRWFLKLLNRVTPRWKRFE